MQEEKKKRASYNKNILATNNGRGFDCYNSTPKTSESIAIK